MRWLFAALMFVFACRILPPQFPWRGVGERIWSCQLAVLRSLRFYMLPGADLSQLIKAEKKVVLRAPQWSSG